MSSTPFTFEKVRAADVSHKMLSEAAELFSSSYGVWSAGAVDRIGKFCKPGHHVRMSVDRLRQQSLAPGTHSVLVRCLHKDELAGHAFATRWDYGGQRVCWVTQLCVRPAFRRQKLATKMLHCLKDGQNDWAFGILSSHPAAILAALRAFGKGIEDVYLDFVREQASGVMNASPIEYVKAAKLKGTLFGAEDEDGSVCCADTSFWVDHAEPLAVLGAVKERGVKWPFGELPEGCEFLVLVGAKGFPD